MTLAMNAPVGETAFMHFSFVLFAPPPQKKTHFIQLDHQQSALSNSVQGYFVSDA